MMGLILYSEALVLYNSKDLTGLEITKKIKRIFCSLKKKNPKNCNNPKREWRLKFLLPNFSYLKVRHLC